MANVIVGILVAAAAAAALWHCVKTRRNGGCGCGCDGCDGCKKGK